MKKIFKFLLLVSLFLLFSQNLVADEKAELKTNLLNKIDEIIVIVEDKKLSKEERNSNIVKAITPMFDFELMAKLSLGKNAWQSLNSEDKKKFTKLYVQRMEKSYSSKLDSYNNEKVEVKKITQPKANRIFILTDLVKNDDKLEIIYKYYKPKKPKIDKERWLIYDVEISGISVLKTDKAQFKEFLRKKNITQLMEILTK